MLFFVVQTDSLSFGLEMFCFLSQSSALFLKFSVTVFEKLS